MESPKMDAMGSSILVPSVQELAKENIVNVPPRYIRPDEDTPLINAPLPSISIPIIDMDKLLQQESSAAELERLHSACKDWGFFQLVNHGVSSSLVEKMESEIKDFFKLPLEEKKRFWQEPGDVEGFGQAFVISEEQKLDWGDMFFLTTLPHHMRKPRLFDHLPLSFRSATSNHLHLPISDHSIYLQNQIDGPQQDWVTTKISHQHSLSKNLINGEFQLRSWLMVTQQYSWSLCFLSSELLKGQKLMVHRRRLTNGHQMVSPLVRNEYAPVILLNQILRRGSSPLYYSLRSSIRSLQRGPRCIVVFPAPHIMSLHALVTNHDMEELCETGSYDIYIYIYKLANPNLRTRFWSRHVGDMAHQLQGLINRHEHRFWYILVNYTRGLRFRETMEAYSMEVNKLAMSILGLMGRALGMKAEEITELFDETFQGLRMNYYPPCPQPESVIGLSPHSDSVGLTVLLQVGEMEGLQIRKEGLWIPVKPLPNAFIINIGDIMEIVTNGIYRSIEHRAMVNSMQERLSIAAFHSPKYTAEMGPAHSLINAENPALFRRVGVDKYFSDLFARKLQGKAYLDSMRINYEVFNNTAS